MATNDYLPVRESELVTWAANFQNKVSTTVGNYGLSPGQVTGLTTLNSAWQASYVAANNNSTRTPSSIQTKNDAKEALINGVNGIRQLVNIIQANPATTNTQRQDLQITVRDVEPTPVPIPTVGPGLSVLSQLGRTARIRLRDIQNPDSRAKPAGVFGATLFYHVGDAAPTDPAEWIFLINTTRTLVDIEWPLAIASGARVWLTSFWFNTRGESSTASAEAISLRVGDQMAQQAA